METGENIAHLIQDYKFDGGVEKRGRDCVL